MELIDQFRQSSSASKLVFKQKVKQDFHLFCTCILHIAGTEVKQVCNIKRKVFFCMCFCVVLCRRHCFVFAKKLAIYILLGQTLIKGFKKI